MANRCRAVIITAMAITLLIACGPAAPTVVPLPLPTTAAPSHPTSTPSPVPPTAAATATAAHAPTSLPFESHSGSLTLTSNRGDKAIANIRTYGGPRIDSAYDVLLLADGGTLIVGQANNTELSHRITPGNARLIRTDAQGNIRWQKDYGEEADAMFYSVIQVGEEEYVVLGEIAASYERDEMDFWLVKVDGEGHEIWSHTYGGRGLDPAKMVRQTADGGFILTGSRADEFPTGDLYQSNIVLIKTDAEGNEVWTHTYGAKILYLAWAVAQTPDGGYVLAGWEAKTIPDRDVLVIKTDEMGTVEWSRTWDLDHGDRDMASDLILTSDGYIVIAGIQSMDSGLRRAVLIKVDLEGNEIWTKAMGGEGVGYEFWDIMEDTDGGYVMAGATITGEVTATGAEVRRGLIVKTDPDGEVLWQYVVSGGEYEQVHFSSAVVLPDGGYIFVGMAKRSGERYWDMLWLELTPSGTTAPPTPTPIAESTFNGARVTFVDNSGFLITVGDRRILIDALYDYNPEGELKPVVSGQPPFDGVDVILATHEHLDHFSPDLVLRYMKNNPSTILVSTQSAIDQTLAVDNSVRDRVIPIQLKRGESKQIVVNDIALEALYISHGEPGLLNLGFVITVGQFRFFHTGDIIPKDVPASYLQSYGLREKHIDVLFVPYVFMTSEEYCPYIWEEIQPRFIIPTHYVHQVPPLELETAFPNVIVFHDTLESLVLPVASTGVSP